MKVSPFAIVTALLTLAQAHPMSSENTGSGVVNVLEGRKEVNDCGNSNFVDHTATDAAKISDCHVLNKNIAGGGTWSWDQSAPRTLATFGTCKFTIEFSGGCIVKVGNEDIINLINTSIAKFGKNGKVGASGGMGCQCVGVTHNTVSWKLHN